MSCIEVLCFSALLSSVLLLRRMVGVIFIA